MTNFEVKCMHFMALIIRKRTSNESSYQRLKAVTFLLQKRCKNGVNSWYPLGILVRYDWWKLWRNRIILGKTLFLFIFLRNPCKTMVVDILFVCEIVIVSRLLQKVLFFFFSDQRNSVQNGLFMVTDKHCRNYEIQNPKSMVK